MKTRFKYIQIALLTTLAGSCSNFLDIEPQNDIAAGSAIHNSSTAKDALTGIYSSMRTDAYYGGNYLLMAEPLGGDAGTGGFSDPTLDEIGGNAITTGNTNVKNIWIAIYNTITNANGLLSALPHVSDLPDEEKAAIEAQAIAIRALAHFDLLRYFGEHWDNTSAFGIPLINSVQKIDTPIKPRATVADTYTFVEEELLKALGKISTQTDRPIAYINKASIEALLARIYLYHKNYAEALKYADIVIADSAYALLPIDNYPNIFAGQTTESIFEIVFDTQNRSRYNAFTYLGPQANKQDLFYLAGSKLKAYFDADPTDQRSKMLNYSTAETDNHNSIVSGGGGRTQKYRGETTQSNPAFVLRLAEMYLIKAEATGLTAGLTGGLQVLNDFRQRRGGLAAVTATDNTTFIDKILDERRAELNFEGHRYFDLARTQKFNAVLGVDSFRAILPIPVGEIIVTKGVLKQNPGYDN